METQQTNGSRYFFTENRDTVLDGLRQGKCDAILPAARTFLDGFAAFILEYGASPVSNPLTASDIVETMLDHPAAWQRNQQVVLRSLK